MGLEKITQIRKQKGISIDDLVVLSGVPKGTLSKISAGITKNPSLETMSAIAKALDCTIDDFRDDVRAVDDVPAWGKPIIDAYAARPEPTQKAVCNVLEIPFVTPGVVDNPIADDDCEDTEPFRKSEQPAAAGTGVYLGPEEFTTIHVRAGCLPQNASFGVPVSGRSMEPKYHDGDILIVSKEKARDGQVGVFTMDGLGYVKRLNGRYLESLNPAYDDVLMEEGTICNGAVIGVLNKDCIVED